MMVSRSRAGEIIREIRHSRHVDESGNIQSDARNARTLQNALSLLSEQLYTKPTHFLMELIQNADDNSYPDGAKPGLILGYHEDGYLWVGCNEKGFEEEDIWSLCDIGESKKKERKNQRGDQGGSKGYIGEKGIGFKAAFKVADSIWISSGHFEFKFERDRPLGMLVPISSKFQEPALATGKTRFCFHIPKQEDRKAVRISLLNIEAELLLFLNKLVRIEVKVYKRISGLDQVQHNLTCLLQEHDADDGQSTLVRRSRVPSGSETRDRVFSTKFSCKDMPAEEKRKDFATSDIVLSFAEPPTAYSNRLVYSFLPVRRYGLSFLLQADFILTADRGSIVEGNHWNEHLVKGAIDAFVSAVEQFNETGLHKFTWPRYIRWSSADSARGTIFEDLLDDLRTELSSSPVLEDRLGNLAKPQSLLTVQERFTLGDDASTPLLDEIRHLRTYVSSGYYSNDLVSLKVKSQTTAAFHDELANMCSRVAWIASKSAQWHSRLAAGINTVSRPSFRDIRLIPLRDGRWVTAGDGPIYFPDINGVDIPEGIEVSIVERTACANANRKQMFRRFGVETLTERRICELILDLHRQLNLNRQILSIQTLIHHAWYVFQYGGSSTNCSNLKFVSEDGSLSPGEKLYLNFPGASFQLKRYICQADAPFRFLNTGYYQYNNTYPGWTQWLQRSAKITLLPKLIRAGALGNQISLDYQYLVDTCQSEQWLAILSDNWEYYRRDAISIRTTFESLLVDCVDHRQRPLGDVYLPTEIVKREPLAMGFAPILDIRDAAPENRTNLDALGLRVRPDAAFFLAILEAQRYRSPTAEDLTRLYQRLHRHFEGSSTIVRAAFINKSLIGIIATDSIQWMAQARCRWRNKHGLRIIASLRERFPSLKAFFVNQLGISDTGAADVLDEILDDCFGLETAGLQRIKHLLLALAKCPNLERQELNERFGRLSRTSILPVSCSGTELFRPAIQDDWFIPDRARLAKSFTDKVYFLNFDEKEIPLLNPIFDRLGINEMRLSRQAREETVKRGTDKHLEQLTQEIQSKSRYVLHLLPTSDAATREAAGRKLEAMEVWSSTGLVLKRYLNINDERIYGSDETGRMLFKGQDDPAILYCSEQDALNGQFPWAFACDQLADFFQISTESRYLLSHILTTQDHDVIHDILERAGVVNEPLAPITSFTEDIDAVDDIETEHEVESVIANNYPASVLQAGTARGELPRESSRIFPVSPSPDDRGRRLAVPRTPSTGPERTRIINENSIIAAAEAWQPHNMRIFGPKPAPSGQPHSANDDFQPVPTVSSPQATVSSFSFRSRPLPTADAFDMRTISATLPATYDVQLRSESSPDVGSTAHDVGYGGELYIFTILQRELEIDENCWTSKMRSNRTELSPFRGLERDYSDFTISTPQKSREFAAWLLIHGLDRASDWLDRDIIYHLEVKSTLGSLNEPFFMSNNQMRFARTYHNDPAHVYIILRVFRLNSDRDFRLYVDPWALMMDGTLCHEAQGGYSVSVSLI